MPRDIYHTEEKTFEKIMSLNSGIKSVLLPWPASGNYYFDSNDEFQLGKYIYLKEVRGRWVAHGKKTGIF